MSYGNVELYRNCWNASNSKHLPNRARKESSSIGLVSYILISVVEILLENAQQEPDRYQAAEILDDTTLGNR